MHSILLKRLGFAVYYLNKAKSYQNVIKIKVILVDQNKGSIYMQSSHYSKNLFLVFTLFLLMSCGGGGGGSSSSSSSPTGSLSISGVAAKGALIGADVQAYEVVNGVLVAYGSPVKTDTDGSYTISSLLSTTNPIVVKVVVNSSTTMRDETQAPGSDGKFPLASSAPAVGTEMRTALTNLTASSDAHITPYTEMAVAAAASAGSISTSSIAAGQDQVLQLIGLNPFTVKPITNSNDSNSLLQKRMMLYLAAVANKAKNTACTGDASGVSCVLTSLKDKVKVTVDGSGNYAPTNAAALKTLITDGFTGLTIPNGSPMASLDLTTEKNKVAVVTSSDPVKSLQTATLDSFLNVMRDGFNTAVTLAKKYTDESGVKAGLHTMALETTKDGFGSVARIIRNCYFNSSKLLLCGASTDPLRQYYNDDFNLAGAGNLYTFSYTDGNYDFSGTVKGVNTGGNLSMLLTATKKDSTRSNQLMSEMSTTLSGSGLIQGSSTAVINIDTFNAKAYYIDNPAQFGTVSLSGIKLTDTVATDKLDIVAPIVITDSPGDVYSGSINLTGYRIATNQNQSGIQDWNRPGYWLFTSAAFDLTVKSATSNIVSVSVTGTQSKDFNSKLPRSSSNDPKANISVTEKFSDNVIVSLSTNETTWGTTAVSGRITSNGNWFQIDFTYVKDGNGKNIVDSNGIKLTSAGVYSATLTQASNKVNGDIKSGTTKIGEIKDNVMQINGRELSFK
jgi:hypothetical protein